MPSLSFRAPGVPLTLEELLSRALPASGPAEREALVVRGGVSLGDRLARKRKSRVAPGQRVEVRDVSAPRPPRAATSIRALAPSLPWRSGVLARRRGCASGVAFEEQSERSGVAELLLTLPPGARDVDPQAFAAGAMRVLAEAGAPILGDVCHGGVLVPGGLRWIAAGDDRPGDWWPAEPVFAARERDAAPPRFRVSDATARILERGHPWVLRDEETDDAGALAPGTDVELTGPSGRVLARACIEGPGRLTARVWSSASQERTSVEARVARALERRRALLRDPDTDAVRLVHGEGDRLPGLFVDRLGSALRVLVTSPGTGSYRGRVLDALTHALESALGADPLVVEVVHLRDRPPGVLLCTRVARGQPSCADPSLVVRECGVRFRVDLGLARPERSSPGIGLYLDQRENRRRLVAGGGGRLLNLFAHTGAFSVAWLSAGLGTAVSVDLSGAYLRRLEENLALNGIDPGLHRSVKQDGRRYLEKLPASERFDAIVLDPPTAASAGRRFWSVARDLPPLIEQALIHLVPGGRLLVSRNDRRRSQLGDAVRRAAAESGITLREVRDAPPGADFPALSGFPEGDPFTAVLAIRS